MKKREHVLDNLEKLYREELSRETQGNTRSSRLDFEFQRDQLYLEILLDIRGLLKGGTKPIKSVDSLLEKAEKIRKVTRLRR
jgi:hypothetical protein